MPPVIKLKNVSLALKSPSGLVKILQKINLSLNKGESVSLVGPSGSGKTSTLLLIAGLEQITSGMIEINGQDISIMDEDELAVLRRNMFGIVFQSFHLVPTMTALENVAIPLELAGHDAPNDRAYDMLKSVGLAERTTHYPSQLSGGEQQRVAIARAFAPSPDIILADEPTGNLDEDNGKHIMDLLFSMQQDYEATLMLITHDSKLAKRCDRMITMRDGKVDKAA